MPDPSNPQFIIAKNPREDSSLPYLLYLPVNREDPVILATRDVWPVDKDLYCHPAEEWPEDPEIVQEVDVRVCRRRGQAIDLLLIRRQRRRSLFVWTRNKRGRTLIFWRSPQSMGGARPGIRVPGARALRSRLNVAVDHRERYAWKFADERVAVVRRDLPVGDYGLFRHDRLFAAVERKRLDDFATSAVSGALSFALQEMSTLPFASLVVEGRLSDLIKKDSVRAGWLMNLVAALQVQFPRVNWMFAETRGIAEDYAYRWFSAVHRAYMEGDRDVGPRTGASVEDIAALPVSDAYGRRAAAAAQSRAGKVWTTREYAEAFDVSRDTARKDLKELVEMGVVEARGNRRTRHFVPADPEVETD